MKQANIDLHIEELILRGLPHAHRQHIGAAVEQELVRLLSEQALPPSLALNGAIPQLNVGPLEVAPNAKPAAVGAQIAQSIYRSLSETGPQKG